MSESGYLLTNQAKEAGIRFQAMSSIFDPITIGHFLRLGVDSGWQCWEVGAGGPSIVQWLSQRVGDSGQVMATDIDTSWTASIKDRNVKIKKHDVTMDDVPGDHFDLVHARLVLVHLTDRDQALQKMIASLKPGGWLLIEDADPALQPLACIDTSNAKQELANKLRSAFRSLMKERGVDLAYGRRLPQILRQAGLAGVEADGYFPVARTACNDLELATVNLLRSTLLTKGLVSEEEIDSHIANVKAGELDLTTAPLISAWGRRP